MQDFNWVITDCLRVLEDLLYDEGTLNLRCQGNRAGLKSPWRNKTEQQQKKERMKMVILALDELFAEPYASIVCYPKLTEAELKKRLKELQRLGIDTLEFTGEKRVVNTPVLGKGCIGIVTLAYKNNEKIALKIRRTDADRESMLHEAELLREANSVDVGPKFLDASENFLLMQFVDGELLPKWLEKGASQTRLKKVLHSVLEQCWRLDHLGLDHGELSHAPKHVIVDGKDQAFIVDFETASKNRKPANVTSICHYLFFSETASKIAVKSSNRDLAVISALRQYKKCRNRENFLIVLESCGL